MKCSEPSNGLVVVIKMTAKDILEDLSANTLSQSLNLIESQVRMIRHLEGIEAPIP